MSVQDALGTLGLPQLGLALAILPISVLLWHIVHYFFDAHGLRKYPGPFLAKFSDFWLFRVFSGEDCNDAIDVEHKKHGPFVRIAPNHLSIASPEALQIVYGHSSGALKSPFYDAFVALKKRGIFNTRSRTEHSRKRRVLSHMFSPQSVRSFEDRIRKHMDGFVSQWDVLCSEVSGTETSGLLGQCEWKVADGVVWFDAAKWCKYFTFDIIGELAFGQQFNMLSRAKDTAVIAKAPQQFLEALSRPDSSFRTTSVAYEMQELSAIDMMAKRAEVIIPLAFVSENLRRLLLRLPFYTADFSAAQQIVGMAVNAVSTRLAMQRKAAEAGDDEAFDDMFGRLLAGKDENGDPMDADELTAEALTLLIAGSDTTGNSVGGMIFYLACDQERQRKLQAELDSVSSADERTFAYDDVKNLPYLDAVINEGLRLFTTVGVGLPRVVPPGGITVLKQFIPEGTDVSVPTYTLNHAESIWGPDVGEFRPERWMGPNKSELMKAFAPFSIGPRACIGRNIAMMEMAVFVATVFHRYDVTARPGEKIKISDGFTRKLVSCPIGVKARSK